jgi:hypothetical protein
MTEAAWPDEASIPASNRPVATVGDGVALKSASTRAPAPAQPAMSAVTVVRVRSSPPVLDRALMLMNSEGLDRVCVGGGRAS